MSHIIYRRVSTLITITDPLIIYRNYVQNGILKPDQQQLRAALEFHKLYLRVKDYVPSESVNIKFKELVRKIELQDKQNVNKNTYFHRKFENWKPKLFQQGAKRTELIKVLTDEEELCNFPSPQGLLINGPVGSGKSLLMDIFASSLPHESKKRWHYHNFMLWIYGEIHLIYKRRMIWNQENHLYLLLENEFILFEILQKMISQSTILILDEFMLPDIAALKLVQILFTYFFKMGGVVVLTSNRLPEELYSTEFNRTQFQGFLEILNARCQSLDLMSDNDYRKILSDESDIVPYLIVKDGNDQEWDTLVSSVTGSEPNWQTDSITCYGREVIIPKQQNGIAKFDFQEICHTLHGPGDYISLASTYHTFIIDHVPVMTTKMRNEARRFITLLDALYECKCKLILRCDLPLDELFFPDDSPNTATNNEDVQNEEMYSKTTIALTNPYRPNISSYNEGSNDYSPISNTHTNFTNLKKFTGEDEMFAYKRAVSRLNEMLGSHMWRQKTWEPIDELMRPWEQRDNARYAFKSHRLTTLGKAYGTLPSFKEVHFWDLVWVRTSQFKDDLVNKWSRIEKLK